LGDINGAGFAFDFIGQVMGQVALAGLAVAAGPAAFAAEGHEGGGDKRALGFELFDAGVELTADQGGMFGEVHRAVRERVQGAGISDTYSYVTEYASKNRRANNFFWRVND